MDRRSTTNQLLMYLLAIIYNFRLALLSRVVSNTYLGVIHYVQILVLEGREEIHEDVKEEDDVDHGVKD